MLSERSHGEDQPGYDCRELEYSVRGRAGDSGLSVPLKVGLSLQRRTQKCWPLGQIAKLDERAQWGRAREMAL